MNAVFADTFYYLALANEHDTAHAKAVGLSHSLPIRLITTAWVLTEVADAMASPGQRLIFLNMLEGLQQDSGVTIIPPTEEWFDRGINLYARRPDKAWSLTDCISFVVMRQYGLSDALTGDRHFEQAGFRALLA
jgi:uncharacterized protein